MSLSDTWRAIVRWLICQASTTILFNTDQIQSCVDDRRVMIYIAEFEQV